MRPRLMLICLAAGSLAATPALSANDPPAPDLKALHAAINKLVGKHYPKAETTLKDGVINFEYNTRKFMIHEPLLTGEWQDAFEEVGPQMGGICGSLSFQSGKYAGMAVVPQSFDKRYYVIRVLAPYSAKVDGHLYVHLKYPRSAPAEFLKDFETLMNGFDSYLHVK